MKARIATVDVKTGQKVVTLFVEDLAPFTTNLGEMVELTVATIPKQEPKQPEETPANVVNGNFPAAAEKVTETKPFESRPESGGTPMGAANADNPNACPLCYGHGLVREFRGENDVTGTTATCKTCGGTGINRENQTPPPIAASDIKPCETCNGDGNDPENGGKRCPTCDGTGIKPAPATA